MKVRTDFTEIESAEIEEQSLEYLWDLSRSDLGGLIDALHERLTVAEKVVGLSDDEDYVRELLGFDPFEK